MKTKNIIIYAFRRARAQMRSRLVLPWQPAHAQLMLLSIIVHYTTCSKLPVGIMLLKRWLIKTRKMWHFIFRQILTSIREIVYLCHISNTFLPILNLFYINLLWLFYLGSENRSNKLFVQRCYGGCESFGKSNPPSR